MSLPYIPGHIIGELKDLRRQGKSDAELAALLHVEESDIPQLLGAPAWKPIPPTDADFDLFATDALDALL